MQKRNFTFLAVNAERKCVRGTSDLWQLRQSRSVEAEFQILSREDRAEVQSSQVGRAEADLNSFDRPIFY